MSVRFDDWEGDYLCHHGVKGQKWGNRRYQNEDGSLTSAGRAHYGYGQGGSRRMGRKYNRQIKKLNKLAIKTDVNAQKAAAEKYNTRAKKAVKVGNIAAGTAAALGLGAYGLHGLAKRFDDKVVDSGHRQVQRLLDANHNYSDAVSANERLVKTGKISKSYGKELKDNLYDNYQNTRKSIKDDEYASRVKNANKRDIAETIRDVKKYAAYGAAATAVGSYGVAAYSKIKSKAAQKRTTAEGHAKAVEKYDKQRAKIEKKFDGTPYAELVKKIISENKKKQKRS